MIINTSGHQVAAKSLTFPKGRTSRFESSKSAPTKIRIRGPKLTLIFSPLPPIKSARAQDNLESDSVANYYIVIIIENGHLILNNHYSNKQYHN
jgi:hypothetical protein